MRWSVEEIRIAESDVLSPGCYLLANVFHHDLALNRPKLALVHRNHWAMPAHMLASTARLGVARAFRGPVHPNLRILAERRQRGSERSQELQSIERNDGLGLGLPVSQRNQTGFELPTQNRLHTQRSQVRFIQWRIQTVATKMRIRIQPLDFFDYLHRQPRRRVHWKIERYKIRFTRHLRR